MQHKLKLNSDKYMESYFKQEASEQRLKKNREAWDQLVTLGVLSMTVFAVTLATLRTDLWVPALEQVVNSLRVAGGPF